MTRTSIPRWASYAAALLLVSGCGSLDLNLAGRNGQDDVAVKEIVCLWEPAEGIGLDGLPTRGFAGQLLFFKPGSDAPVPVEGDVRIYVFDDHGTPEEQARPLHQFDFPSEAFQTFARDTNLGPAYQLFVPYTRKGRNYAECALRVRLTAEGQLPVYSKMASIALPGRRVAGDAPSLEGPDGAETATAAAATERAAHAAPAETIPIPMSTPSAAELDRLRRAAQGAVQNADFMEGEPPTAADEEGDTVTSRRYRMSGRIQQASAVIE